MEITNFSQLWDSPKLDNPFRQKLLKIFAMIFIAVFAENLPVASLFLNIM